MTPLERAKAFVKSRAAKTALKILPLALAAATVAVPTAKANVVINPTDAHFTGCDPNTANCSGLFALASSSTSFALLSPGGGVQGAIGGGTGIGVWVGTGTDNTQNWDFVLKGDDTGSTDGFFSIPVDQLIIGWSFSLQGSSGGVTIGPAATLLYDFNDGSTDLQGTCAVTNFSSGCLVSGLSTLGSPTSWSLTLEVPVTSASGTDAVQWNVDFLGVIAPPVTTTPEPASMTLTLIAVPFLVRRLRKRQ